MKFPPLVAISFLVVLLVSFAAQAHQGASGPTKARMDAMVDMGRALKKLTIAARNEAEPDDPALGDSMSLLVEKGGHLKKLFETREIPPVSEALPAIWDEPEKFGEWIDQYNSSIAIAQTALKSGNRGALDNALRQTNQACGGCHQAFRK